jgi:RNA polymerase sigma factor for flagellar operon FliA
MQQQLAEKELQLVWEDYFLNQSHEAKSALMLHYIWLVKYALHGMNLPTYSILNEDDFLHIGIVGLSEALDRYEPQRGLKFETFAMPRIKGIVLDEMRRLDWLTRTARKKVHDYMDAADALRKSEGREVSSEEIRIKLNVTREEYSSYLAAAAAAISTIAMQEGQRNSGMNDDDDHDPIHDIADPDWNNVLHRLADEEQAEYISNFLTKLPERKRNVMMMYYYEELNFKEIGHVLNVTESRVCQIHSQVVHDLRRKLIAFENA